MEDLLLDTGKHAGRRLTRVYRLDPDYMAWLASRCPYADIRAAAGWWLQNPPPDPVPFMDPWIDADELAEFEATGVHKGF